MHYLLASLLSQPRTATMTKPVFAPGSAILRVKPLFELCDAGIEPKRVKKLPLEIGSPTARQQVVPFDSETILETVDSSPAARIGNSASLARLTSINLELANVEDLNKALRRNR
jgi:hypothetical protein